MFLAQWCAHKGCAGGEVAAHAVHASAGRRRGRADVEPIGGGGVRRETEDRSGEELAEVYYPAVDVAAYMVGVGAMEIRWIPRAFGKVRSPRPEAKRSI